MMQRLPPAPGPHTPAHQAPVRPDPGWNTFRARVIEAVLAAENLLRQHGTGLDDEGMTCEVAPVLGLTIATLEDFETLCRVVGAVRYVARDTLSRVQTRQGGQFALLLS